MNLDISKNIRYVGVNDHNIDLFEGQYPVQNGMAYNSYVILDEKIAVMDSVDARFGEEWLKNIEAVLDGRKPDYLVVQHMEPDHSANIVRFLNAYPEAKVVSCARAFMFMKSYFGTDFKERQVVVAEGQTLDLGEHHLQFVSGMMVHWPEVTMTYETKEKVFFSADAFGKFGANDVEEPWLDEARRYYIGIVGVFGTHVQKLLGKAAGLDIEVIAPLHGPVLKENLGYYLNLYNIWSSYTVEEEGVLIAYTSVYGHTKEAVELLAKTLEEKGQKVVVMDLNRCDMAEAVANAFRFGNVVLATTTYVNDMFPTMKDFLHRLVERNFSGRKIGIVENGTWGPVAGNAMKKVLEPCKDLVYCEASVKILAAMNEANKAQIAALADELC